MQERAVIERVEMVEHKVELLEQLPDRVTAVERQLVLLRTEMRGELSALRGEMQAGDEETRRYMRVLHEDLVDRIGLLGESRPRRKNESRPRRKK